MGRWSGRNLAAPEERRILAGGQLESAWPTLSTVTVARGTVCAVAGRHNMAEGGILITGFDLNSGKKKWQMAPAHRPMSNLLTAGAYARKSLKPDDRANAAAIGGWLVCDGDSVQIDHLGAADLVTGDARERFDVRLEESYTGILRPLKNGSSRSDFEPWLLSASDGDVSFGYHQKTLKFKGGEGISLLKAPAKIRSIASVGDAWLILGDGEIIFVDKKERRVRATVPFEGAAIQHGLAVGPWAGSS